MKLKYKTLSKEDKKAIKQEFLTKQESIVYKKASNIIIVSLAGILLALISTIFDIIYKMKTINFVMDGFLLIFSLIFLIIMSKIKLKEINKFLINKNKKK